MLPSTLWIEPPFNSGPIFFGNTLLTTENHRQLLSLDDFYRGIDRERDVFDRLTLELCAEDRKNNQRISLLLLRAEKAAWLRIRARNSHNSPDRNQRLCALNT